MIVKVACSSCRAQFAAQPHLYGKNVRCPKCGGVVAVPDPNRATGRVAPLAAPVDPLATSQPAPSGMQPHSTYRPRPTESGLDVSDKKVLWYSVSGACAILLLLVGAISVSRLTSGDGEQAVADVKAVAGLSARTGHQKQEVNAESIPGDATQSAGAADTSSEAGAVSQ